MGNIPNAKVSVLNPDGSLTLPWRLYLQGVSSAGGSVDPAVIAAIEAALAALAAQVASQDADIETALTDSAEALALAEDGSVLPFVNLHNLNPIDLSTGVFNNLPVRNLAGGTNASGTTYWRGDGTWQSAVSSIVVASPLTGGTITTTGTIAMGTVASAGTYTNLNATIDSFGRVTAAANGSAGTGTVTSIATSAPLTGGPITTAGTIGLGTLTTAGTYTNLNATIDGFGRITAAANGSPGTGTVTSVVAGTGLNVGAGPAGTITTAGTLNLNTTGVSAGSYSSANITVDANGRITTAANGTGGGGTSAAIITLQTSAANRNITGWTQHPLGTPASPDARNDEFDSSSASIAAWTQLGSTSAPAALDYNTTAKSNAYLLATIVGSSSTHLIQGIYKAYTPTIGDTITVFLTDMILSASFNMAGLFLSTATPGAVVSACVYFQASNDIRYAYVTWPNLSGAGSTVNTIIDAGGPPCYLRFVYNSSTSVSAQFSRGGFLWSTIAGAQNPAITIGSVGLFVNSQNGTFAAAACFDFIRFNWTP